jgi:CDP-glucose 4,6-dehydratase
MKKKNFWYKKNVLITGITGFVGSNLAKNLIENKANVTGIGKSQKVESLLFYENIDKKCNLVFGNILDKDLIQNTIRKYNIEICFHLAAQIEVGSAKRYPFETWESNIRGTYNILEAIRTSEKNIKAIIIASSDKAYGEYGIKKMPYKENYELKPIFPYDTSKACADMIARSYASKLYKLPIIITRFSNIFGPGQLNFTALIPEAIRSCILNYKFLSRSNGKGIRDFIYVDDIVDVYKLLAEKLFKNPKKYSGEIFNAGTGKKYTIKYIVSKIFSYGNKNIKNIFNKRKKMQGEILVQYMNYKKLNKYFSWKPKNNFEKVLPSLFEWYKKYLFKNK